MRWLQFDPSFRKVYVLLIVVFGKSLGSKVFFGPSNIGFIIAFGVLVRIYGEVFEKYGR